MTNVAFKPIVTCLVLVALLTGCKKQETTPPEVPPLAPMAQTRPSTDPAQNSKAGPLPPGPSGELPPGHPPISMPGNNGMPGNDSQAGGVELDEAPEQFAGIKLVAPEGWKAIKPAAPRNSGFVVAGPIAVFKLEKAKEDKVDALVRLTHFPGMKDIPVDAQMNRWYQQVSQPDGGSTRDIAKVDSWEADGVKVSVADMTGKMASEPGTVRMIAAVIEHPQGPHFLKAIGPVDTLEHWHESIMTYLRTAVITE